MKTIAKLVFKNNNPFPPEDAFIIIPPPNVPGISIISSKPINDNKNILINNFIIVYSFNNSFTNVIILSFEPSSIIIISQLKYIVFEL